ncbi:MULTISPECIES: DUF2637 domain-containing protein [Streptomyces]|uniref:DUF2637 domain-containing protein n=1 Tax=Streptomyces nigrescens TaxID=1920 RepID=A0A640TNE7_STRNI|nr:MULTISPECIES: DUF2637 domain-containing protein [Streptomyces]WAT98089.1 DUF2637 domain-containing protein [Streptomyces libani subsp. libani]WDT56160.1 DUF2637 domain-containing protein [Streptomyces sp. G7(2002)]GFE23666.1 hypothetical protein Sliba_41190 [Streptomyces libani subsp. libani]GGV93666.1 hypothetical protein GCM10010500_29880 [Streptomyces libani subsp. libani]
MPSTPAPLPGTATIRLGIALLGAIGFALSYDALRQMALAIHIRGPLTYAFPLVIDGFIAIGICALIILRTAPLRSRLYVWALVGTATVTSIWANALHAIHLNHRTQLHLDDVTVGALSAIAPLALAGAVHLYLVIRRHLATHRPQEGSATHRHTALVGQPGRADTPLQYAHSDGKFGHRAVASEGPADEVAEDSTDHVAEDAALVAEAPESRATSKGRQPSATMDELLDIGRTAPLGRNGRVSRRHVEAAIRAKGLPIGKDRLNEIKDALQADLDRAPARAA